MEARTIPHAYPMSVEYELASPSRIYDQNFGEGKHKQSCKLTNPFSAHTTETTAAEKKSHTEIKSFSSFPMLAHIVLLGRYHSLPCFETSLQCSLPCFHWALLLFTTVDFYQGNVTSSICFVQTVPLLTNVSI